MSRFDRRIRLVLKELCLIRAWSAAKRGHGIAGERHGLAGAVEACEFCQSCERLERRLNAVFPVGVLLEAGDVVLDAEHRTSVAGEDARSSRSASLSPPIALTMLASSSVAAAETGTPASIIPCQMVTDEQRVVCDRYGAQPMDAPSDLKVGLALASVGEPINGLRHPPEGDTTGWYLWRGELSQADDFFSPLHAGHLSTRLPEVLPYLALPPGWRFLIAPGYEDVWYDASLLDISGD